MKKFYRYFSLIVFFSVFGLFSGTLMADPPIPPAIPGSHGTGGNAGAPIDNFGILLLIAGSAYAGWMLYKRSGKAEEKSL